MTKIALAALPVASDHVRELNKDFFAPEKKKEDKTEARKRLEREIKENFARSFEAIWKRNGGPVLKPEFKFCSDREWHSDYFVETHKGKFLIELEGGVWTGGRHTQGKGFINDCVKYNMAELMGYHVIRIPTGFDTDHYLSEIIQKIV